MDQRTFHLLEFPKVLDELARFARSESGADACRTLTPIEDADELTREARLSHEFVRFTAESPLRIGQFPPLDGLFAYLERPSSVLDLDGLFALKAALTQARAGLDALAGLLDDPLAGTGDERFPLLTEMARTPWPARTWQGLGRCLNVDGGLKDQASPELMSVRSEIRRIHQTCTKKAKDYILGKNLGHLLMEDFITIAGDRYVLPLKTGYKNRLDGVIHDYSQTGETCYFEPLFLVDLNNELQDLKQEEREAERAVMTFLTSLVRSEFDDISRIYALVNHLDVLGAKAAFAGALNAHMVIPESGAPLNLLNARHPLLAAAQARPARAKAAETRATIPIDISLLPGQRAMVISGGNAGGKTVCLKTLGLTALMCRSAVPVPVDEGSTMPLLDRIFVILGDEQSLEDHVSTFTAQITRLSKSWDEVDARSLVLLDEFGAGTDPTQGAALAQAVVDTILEKGAWLSAATHFPALKVFAMTDERVRAASVLFDPDSKKPLYRIGYDQVGASQALVVAREHGLPTEVLERAESLMLLDSTDTSALMERLNTLAVENEKATRALESEREKLREKRIRLDDRFEKEKKKLLDEMRATSRDVLHQLKSQKISHKKALKEMAQAREKLAAQRGAGSDTRHAGATGEANAAGLDPKKISPKDSVKYLPWDRQAVVEEVDLRKQAVKIDLSGVSMWVKLEDLAAGDAKQAPKMPGSGAPAVKGTLKTGLSADLRGMRADVAVAQLERSLDRALLDNFSSLEVVHGRGTGALRKEVHEFLRHHPAVAHFELASEEHGGDGMTIVELK